MAKWKFTATEGMGERARITEGVVTGPDMKGARDAAEEAVRDEGGDPHNVCLYDLED